MINESQFSIISAYVEVNYKSPVDKLTPQKRRSSKKSSSEKICAESDIDKVVSEYKQGERFNQMLDRLMNERHMKISDVCQKSGLDRRIFFKIRHNDNYSPTKETITKIALALQLTLDETDALLKSAGRAFVSSDLYDVVISICIKLGIYDLKDIDEAVNKCTEKYQK